MSDHHAQQPMSGHLRQHPPPGALIHFKRRVHQLEAELALANEAASKLDQVRQVLVQLRQQVSNFELDPPVDEALMDRLKPLGKPVAVDCPKCHALLRAGHAHGLQAHQLVVDVLAGAYQHIGLMLDGALRTKHG